MLIHAPAGSGAASMVRSVLAAQAIETHECETPAQLLAAMEEGAAGAVLAEEALPGLLRGSGLAEWLARQPPWSDFPFLVLGTEGAGPREATQTPLLRSLGTLILLERPLNPETLASAAELVVRARRRQYAARHQLEELGHTRSELERLNAELELRIETRTRELASANDRLMKEIAERERAQAALTQVQKMEAIGRLTGGIAHDFNNLLHVVNMNLELVSLYAKEDKVKPVVERAKAAARRGARLTGQLLSFARSQSLMPRFTNVNTLLLGMKDLLEISVGSGVEVEYDLCEQPAAVVLDASQLEMAILNLAVNSRDAMPEGGKLTVATRTEQRTAEVGLPVGDYVLVRVSDSGGGIAPHVLPKVFEPFFTTKPLGRGTGLGLSQVYGFAQQSGGVAHIVSEPGKGTTVDMLFPAADADAEQELPPPQQQALPDPAKASHILVVEDDADVRRVIVECLSLIGYRVTEAANGAEALEAVGAAKPDLMLVDYAMPDMTGAEVIARTREAVGELPVILATGYADMAAVERLVGKPDILRKPFDISALGDAVKGALDNAREKKLALSSG